MVNVVKRYVVEVKHGGSAHESSVADVVAAAAGQALDELSLPAALRARLAPGLVVERVDHHVHATGSAVVVRTIVWAADAATAGAGDVDDAVAS